MNREFAEITANHNIGADLFLTHVIAPSIANVWIPGQFVHILPPIKGDRPPMLRRPVSILASKDKEIEFVYRVVGDGTKLLSEMSAGEKLDVIGPLGNGFDSIPDTNGKHILIGGGVGAPPIIALARYMHLKSYDVELFQGAKDSVDLILNEELEKSPFNYSVTTEDGSVGTKGLIIDILPEPSDEIACVYSCGPVGMMRAIYNWCGKNKFPYFASLENKLGCGVGVCLGCSIPTTTGHMIRSCKNGPVFDADQIEWDRM